ncbi:MAG: hypothetical protein ACOX6P_03080 [Candidatus Merdivicinus sp.]|jgi:hypothetical protein
MLKLSKETRALLEDIENRIDPEAEDDVQKQWKDFLDGKFDGKIFTSCRKTVSEATVPYQNININDAIEDYEKMLVSQMEGVSHILSGTSGIPSVRTNYGTGIMTALFGAKIFTMPYEMNTLPTTHSFNNTDIIHEILEKGMPDLMGGFGRKVFEMGEIFAEVFAEYPKISKYVTVYHPDTQGPLDICELLWGGEMFYAMYDEPELVHGLLKLVTETYIAFMEKWFAMYPCSREMNCHWGSFMHHGKIVLRDDSAMNLSPALYEEYAKPYDAQLLHHFEGGVVHFCGRGDHYMKALCEIPDLTGINMSQPHLNDMETIYRNTVEKGIKILGFNREWAEKDVGRPGGFFGNLHA